MKAVARFTIASALVLAFAPLAHARTEVLKEIEEAFVRLHEDVRPSVVNIDTKGSMQQGWGDRMGPHDLDDLFRFFGPMDERRNPMEDLPKSRATGSGFILDKEGHIVTNNHVVDGAEEITVRLWDGKEFPAKTVGMDPDTDLAVIKIEPDEELPVARLGDSSQLKVGQFAIALGSPRGFEGSLSFGHISALGRENLAGLAAQGLRFQNLVQTDAAINLGNSGGPLVNIDGEVIGINIAIVYGANSLGFAIPVNTAKEIVPQLISGGKVVRGYLGVQIMDAKEFADSLGLPDMKGAFVKQVQPGTPAERANLQTYDVIRKVNGTEVENASGLVSAISALPPGVEANLEVWRDGQTIEVKVNLDEWNPKEAQPASSKETLGVRVRGITPEIAQRLGLEENAQGVLVTDVKSGSAADDAGLAEGDFIIEINREQVTNPDDFHQLVEKHAQPGKSLIVRFIRGGQEPDITIIKVPKAAQ